MGEQPGGWSGRVVVFGCGLLAAVLIAWIIWLGMRSFVIFLLATAISVLAWSQSRPLSVRRHQPRPLSSIMPLAISRFRLRCRVPRSEVEKPLGLP